MSVLIDPCGCDESTDLTKALEAIKKARQEFDLAQGADWGILIDAIDNHIDVLATYAYARTKDIGE